MKREGPFRGAVAALLCAAVAISGYHRHRAEQVSEEKVSWREEGLPVIVELRASVLVLSLLAYLINPRWMRWSSVELPAGLQWAGACLGAGSLFLGFRVFRAIDKNITPTVETREDHELITHGRTAG
jgi:protein-S-isoprenylcysteine O-methyltransferase Ste14